MSLKWFRLTGVLSLALLGSFLATPRAAAQQQGWPLNPQNRWWEGSSNRSYRPSSLPAAAVAQAPAQVSTQIQVQVPAGAKLWFDGRPTSQAGTSRDFVSPPLAAGFAYRYTIHAEWREGERLIEQDRVISFQPGDSVHLDFTMPTVAVSR